MEPMQYEHPFLFFIKKYYHLSSCDSLLLLSMRNHSNWQSRPNKHQTREQLDTRWATETIQPIWHFVAAFQNIAQNKLKSIKRQAFHLTKQNMLAQRQMQEFAHHCAVLIQSRFKGYMQRKYYLKFLPLYRRFRSLMLAAVAGWRTRKILKTKTMKTMRKNIIQFNRKGQQRQARIMRRNFIYQFKQLQKKGKWVKIYLSQFPPQTNPKKKVKIVNIKKALYQIPKKQEKQQQVGKKENIDKNINLEKVEQVVTPSVDDWANDIPIKASGKYEIPECIEMEQVGKKTVRQVKKKTGGQKNPFTKKNTLKIELIQDKSEKLLQEKKEKKELKNISNQSPKQKTQRLKTNIDDISQLSIHLPVEEEIHQNLNDFGQTIRFKQISLAPTPKNNKSSAKERNRFSERKGISLTITQSSRKMQEEKEQVFPPDNQAKDGLSQILDVYNDAYRQKREQLQQKLLQVKLRSKFSQHC